MSWQAVEWAFAAHVGTSAKKLVLVALAENANETCGEAWPSVALLEIKTELNRKTIIAALTELEADGWIINTGKRAGTTKQIPVWSMNFACRNSTENGIVPPNKQYRKRNSTENGTVPFLPAKSPVFTQEASRFYAESIPKTGHVTIREPERNQEGNQERESACAHTASFASDDAPPSLSASLDTQQPGTTGQQPTLPNTPKPTKPKPIRLPDEWQLTEAMREWAVANCAALDLELATAEFCDYWRGAAGSSALKLDWVAAWRNGMRANLDKGRFLHRPNPVNGVPGVVSPRYAPSTAAQYPARYVPQANDKPRSFDDAVARNAARRAEGNSLLPSGGNP